MSNQKDHPVLRDEAPLELNSSAYRLTLSGLVMPVSAHLLYNAIAALSIFLLGHPLVAMIAFVMTSGTDTLFQREVARRQAASPPCNAERALVEVAALCAVRNLVLLGPVIFIAMSRAPADLVYFGVVVAILWVLAGVCGVLSRPVFYAYAGPPLAASVAVVLADFSGAKAVAILIVLLIFGYLLTGASRVTNRAMGGLRNALGSNRALVAELEQARDQALAERAAADEAREAARRANSAKSNFLATMSHEIRTPMNGVLGMAQLLRRDEADPGQIQRLDTLVESGQYLLSILNDILDVSKIDAGRLELNQRPEDLRRFLGQVVEFWGARADERGVTLRLEIADEVPPFVDMDALRLRQILFNLIGNALKFTEAGSVVLRVDARPDAFGVSQVRFAVRDTGPGIAAEHLPALFDRFSQGEESEVRRFGGTGLGLAIAKQLTELMGGRICVESALGHGSSFQIELPLTHTGAPVRPIAEIRETAPGAPAELSLLIVDDNAVNLLVLEQLLSAVGHRVAKAASGREALDQLAVQPFDLVLMDIQMPQMTGTEALRALRQTPGPNQATPVIALTADVTSGGRGRYLELGFDEHTAKPVQIADLMDAIARTVEPHADRREVLASA